MKDRPILFSAPMVRAILDGRKTQTRRVVKCQYSGLPLMVGDSVAFLDNGRRTGPDQRCPYGTLGDRLWVREAWAQNENQLSETRMDRSIVYRADGEARALDNGHEKAWRPSIHMPRWASRITLEITDVRVQRLQEISDEDALAEGLRSDGSLGAQCSVELPGHRTHHDSPKECFRLLWESIHGPGSWEQNPWVWAITFKRAP